MTTSVIGLFESRDVASKVLGELTKAGFDKKAVEILQGVAVSEISSRLVDAGYEQDRAKSYGQAVEKGGALVVAETTDDKADEALSTMRRFEVLTPEALMEKIGGSGTEKAQVIEEELEVGKTRTTGGKRLEVSVSEREVQESVTLHEETVDVERTKADRVLKPGEADKAFQDRTVEMTEIKEKPVVSKQAHVVEEVALTKQSGEREATVSGTVRRQDVTVEEIDRKSGKS
ncbi:YsnF/AvaK domain-containing protein [Skermanella mucosa]|uniref:YsnF/AvaK domain-containing protein n=1 Tax=Skermanella mucosa TaxID=1789672 RepID=UPI00192B414D|nr:YsnF/AvaK domain-containing protein [Skermanella mucosa]UEM20186.1 YsnF/AvaK domain-containing protein [Skermanella mucosa]